VSYQVRNFQLPILPSGAKPMRILHFSDLHLTPNRKKEIADIQSFAELKPDLVVATGDFLAHPNSVPVVLTALEELLDLPGLFVFGSNDYYAPQFKNPLTYLMPDNGKRKLGKDLPWEGLATSLSQFGWINLNHAKTFIEINGLNIEVRGTDDAHLNRDNYAKVAGMKSTKADLAFGVTHAPYLRLLTAMAEDQLDLIFAGHTHGGQIRLPWFGGTRSLTTNCDLPNWRSRGLTQGNNPISNKEISAKEISANAISEKINQEPWLSVSAGMGYSPFVPFRIFCPPEVNLIELI
jgi:uncharacterized protein